VRIVVDSGLARVPRYEPDVGLTRLETVRVSRAAADQRRGRAGRTEPGVCYRLWDEPQTASLEAYARPEICRPIFLPSCSISPPGARRRRRCRFSIPAEGALAEAARIGSLNWARSPTVASPAKAMRCAACPLPPRLARMVG
jgi:ATP-dependent helicase HrpB